MAQYLGAGKLDKPAQVLECQEAGDGVWKWVPVRRIWAAIDLQQKTNLFSKIGVGARDAAIVIWQQELTLHNAIRQGGTHFFLTSITERNRNQLDVRAALCEPVTLTAKPKARTGRDALNRPIVTQQPSFTFPGILTELYHRNAPDEIYRTETLQRVLVTPKVIRFRTGDLVQAGDEAPYTVRQVMDLDPYKNEYVIERQEDV